jgi:acyl carrier protein
MSLHERIREFILRSFLFSTDETRLANDTSLTRSGIVDSMGVLEVLLFLERTWNIKLEDDELTLENLDSVNGIAALVSRKVNGRPQLP